MKSPYPACLASLAFLFPAVFLAQTADTFHLSGCAQYWANKQLVPNVQMTVGVGPLTNPAYVFTGTLSTDSTCSEIAVTPDSAAPQTGYWLIGEKKDTVNDYRNGLSVGDLICINKHILGLEPLQPIVQFAADANRSRSITTFDITEITRLLLGIYDELPNVPAWMILSPDCHFAGPSDPFPTNPCPTFSVDPLADFENKPAVLTAVKTGDVNGDYAFNGNYSPVNSLAGHSFNIPDRVLKAGETITVPLYWKTSFYSDGIQFALRYDTNVLRFDDIIYNATFPHHWAVFSGQGLLKHASVELFNYYSDTLAYFRFSVQSDGLLSQAVSLDSTALPPRYYTDCSQAGRLRLEFDIVSGLHDLPSAVRLSPPVPNPFSEKTTMSLLVERPVNILLEVTDAAGRLTYSVSYDLLPGRHNLEIPPGAVPAGGMAFYRLRAGDEIFAGKILRM